MTKSKPEDSQTWIDPAELPEYEGQLAVDVYQTEDTIVVLAPIAGVSDKNIEISITDEVVTIRGHRHRSETVAEENYFAQECYWGPFSRSYLLPMPVEADHGHASLKDGILTVTIPKQEKAKTKMIKVTAAE